jgi:hypothetical protein
MAKNGICRAWYPCDSWSLDIKADKKWEKILTHIEINCYWFCTKQAIQNKCKAISITRFTNNTNLILTKYFFANNWLSNRIGHSFMSILLLFLTYYISNILNICLDHKLILIFDFEKRFYHIINNRMSTCFNI